jgi:YbbR domain-containing protein
MAIFLFAFHSINLLKTKTISSRLEIEGHTELIITNIVPESVSVRLRGNENDIIDISGEDIITFIDLSPYSVKGTYRAPVQIIKNGRALNTSMLEISVEPVDIKLNLDKAAERYIKVFSNITGSVAPGYELVSGTITPDQVKVGGPASLLEKVTSIATEPLDVSGRYGDFSLMLNLVKPDPLFTIYGGSTVEYRAVVREASIEKDFSDIPVGAVNTEEDFDVKIIPETGSAKIRGSYSGMKSFVTDNLLTVDCSGIKSEGSFDLPVNVNIGESFTVSSYEPETVSVEITKRKQ